MHVRRVQDTFSLLLIISFDWAQLERQSWNNTALRWSVLSSKLFTVASFSPPFSVSRCEHFRQPIFSPLGNLCDSAAFGSHQEQSSQIYAFLACERGFQYKLSLCSPTRLSQRTAIFSASHFLCLSAKIRSGVETSASGRVAVWFNCSRWCRDAKHK